MFNLKKEANSIEDISNFIDLCSQIKMFEKEYLKLEETNQFLGQNITQAIENHKMNLFYKTFYDLDDQSISDIALFFKHVKALEQKRIENSLFYIKQAIFITFDYMEKHIRESFSSKRNKVKSGFQHFYGFVQEGLLERIFDQKDNIFIETLLRQNLLKTKDVNEVFSHFIHLNGLSLNLKNNINNIYRNRDMVQEQLLNYLNTHFKYLSNDNHTQTINSLLKLEPSEQTIDCIKNYDIATVEFHKNFNKENLEKHVKLGLYGENQPLVAFFDHGEKEEDNSLIKMQDFTFGLNLSREEEKVFLLRRTVFPIDLTDKDLIFFIKGVEIDSFFKYKYEVVIVSPNQKLILHSRILIDNPEDVYQVKFEVNNANLEPFIKGDKANYRL